MSLKQRREYQLVAPPWMACSEGEAATAPFRILLAFSGIQQALTSTPGYNLRVEECSSAARKLLRVTGRGSDLHVLRSVSLEDYITHKDCLTVAENKRATHFYSECTRVQQGIEAWESGDMVALGRLMNESGRSSVINYECGSEALIQLQDIVSSTCGVYGARFSGAGFRGCCVALVASHHANQAATDIEEAYRKLQPRLVDKMRSQNSPVVRLVDSVDGAAIF